MGRHNSGETSVHSVRLSVSAFMGRADNADGQHTHIATTAMAPKHHLVGCKIQDNPRELISKKRTQAPSLSHIAIGACEAFHGKLHIRDAYQNSRRIADQTNCLSAPSVRPHGYSGRFHPTGEFRAFVPRKVEPPMGTSDLRKSRMTPQIRMRCACLLYFASALRIE